MAIKTVLTCDGGCGKTLELDGPYHVAKDKMRAAGWKNVKVGEEWKIKCPGCGK
jgi:hypothetical protein